METQLSRVKFQLFSPRKTYLKENFNLNISKTDTKDKILKFTG